MAPLGNNFCDYLLPEFDYFRQISHPWEQLKYSRPWECQTSLSQQPIRAANDLSQQWWHLAKDPSPQQLNLARNLYPKREDFAKEAKRPNFYHPQVRLGRLLSYLN